VIDSLSPPVQGLILDLDGVLWRGNQPLGNLPSIFDHIASRGLRVVLATNNATLSIRQYQEKLASFGVHLDTTQIINSAQALAFALHTLHPEGGPVFIVGETGLTEALSEEGFYRSEDGGALAVAVGLDRGITYEKLKQATLLIRNGIAFYGTNPDATYPAPEGLIPGAGSLLAAIQTATGVAPVIAGKPARPMLDLAMARLGTTVSETLMVGDRLDTDITGGQHIGMRTALVLTGVSTIAEAQDWSPPPDIIAPDLTTLLGILPAGRQ
jgi:4-nitrophenyl phosphatase